MMTRGFSSEIPKELKTLMVTFGLAKLQPKEPTFIVFDPDFEVDEVEEDDGRSIRKRVEGLSQKVYAKLDDFGSVHALRENMGIFAPPDLDTQYVVTFLLAEEY